MNLLECWNILFPNSVMISGDFRLHLHEPRAASEEELSNAEGQPGVGERAGEHLRLGQGED